MRVQLTQQGVEATPENLADMFMLGMCKQAGVDIAVNLIGAPLDLSWLPPEIMKEERKDESADRS